MPRREWSSRTRVSSAAIAAAATDDESDGHHELRNAAVPNDVPKLSEWPKLDPLRSA